MTNSHFFNILFVMTGLVLVSCNSAATRNANETEKNESSNIREEAVTYNSDTATLNGYVTYDEYRQGKRPVVLIVPEWWGLTDYPRMRAKMLAELGYLAMAVDMYGHGKTADNPKDAQALAGPFYQNPKMAYDRLMAAAAKAKTFPQADTSQIVAIGYCFGGGVVLNAARLGAPLAGVVSFHGSLQGTPANKDLLKSKVLVCQGEADQFVPSTEVAAFKKSMDSIKADYTFKSYSNAMHAFTNPAATDLGKKFNLPIAYNPQADTASWTDMKTFFGKILKFDGR